MSQLRTLDTDSAKIMAQFYSSNMHVAMSQSLWRIFLFCLFLLGYLVPIGSNTTECMWTNGLHVQVPFYMNIQYMDMHSTYGDWHTLRHMGVQHDNSSRAEQQQQHFLKMKAKSRELTLSFKHQLKAAVKCSLRDQHSGCGPPLWGKCHTLPSSCSCWLLWALIFWVANVQHFHAVQNSFSS